ncbi:MAG: response regulator [Vicinamibacteria bacterium]
MSCREARGGRLEREYALARSVQAQVRLHDVVGLAGDRVGLLMPDTTMSEACLVAERLVRGEGAAACAAGVATVYGEVEGEGDALLVAAADALRRAQPGKVAPSGALQGRPGVLVVDDEPLFARLLAELVTQRGWDGHPCTDPVDALQRVKGETYSALFVDLVLGPEISGVDVIREALAWHPGRPAVLMSARDNDRHQSIFDALELGPVTFVRKPVSLTDLDASLEMFRSLLPGLGRKSRKSRETEGSAGPSADY